MPTVYTSPLPQPALPVLSRESVLLANRLLLGLLPHTFLLDSGSATPTEVELTCPFLSADMEESDAFGSCTLYVNCDGLWKIELDNLDLLALRPEFAEWQAKDPGNTFSELPPNLIRAAFERLFLPALDTIAALGKVPAFMVSRPPRADKLFSHSLIFQLRHAREGSPTLSTRLRLSWQDTVTLNLCLERIESVGCIVQHLPAVTRIPILARILLGKTRLNWDEITSLNRGDILFGNLALMQGGEIEAQLLFGGGGRIACDLSAFTLTVRGSINMGENGMDEQAQSPSQAEQSPLMDEEDLKNIELDVSFELPALKLSLAECAALTVGSTLTLGQDVASLPVAVTVSGRVVAYGRMVDVEGEVGVQLTRVSGTDIGGDRS